MPAKEFRYRVEVDRGGRALADGRSPVERDEIWTPEHLVLAGLARCTIASLEFHAARTKTEVEAEATVSGRVTKREEDGRYAFVELDCRLEVRVAPEPHADQLAELISLAERDCFIGASLTAKPRYAWRVNGREL